MKKTSILSTLALSAAFITANAATTFITNTGGNAAPLQGDGAGATTALPLSVGDGGGTIDVNTIGVFVGGATTLGMDTNSMGVSNDKWGDPSQEWQFSFGQDVDFDGLVFFGGSLTYTLESAAWKDDSNTTGTGWSFTSDSTTGKFVFSHSNGTTPTTFDFTTSGVSSVTAGTQISLRKSGGASGGELANFTITPVPEPSSAALLGLGGLALILRRRK